MNAKTIFLLPLLLAVSCNRPLPERNVALHRAATASSATDYNLTAQLATDGIIEESSPASMRFWLNGTPVPREEADWLLDERDKSKFTCSLNSFELELKCEGCGVNTDAVCYYATFLCKNTISYAPYCYVILATRDGENWVRPGDGRGPFHRRRSWPEEEASACILRSPPENTGGSSCWRRARRHLPSPSTSGNSTGTAGR